TTTIPRSSGAPGPQWNRRSRPRAAVPPGRLAANRVAAVSRPGSTDIAARRSARNVGGNREALRKLRLSDARSLLHPIPVGSRIRGKNSTGASLDRRAHGSLWRRHDPLVRLFVAVHEREVSRAAVEARGQVAPLRSLLEPVHEEAVVDGIRMLVEEHERH